MSRTTLVLGDIHFPWPHKPALAAVRRLITALKPHRIVQVGDLLDLYGISRFSKDPSRGLTLKAEAALGRDFIAEMMDSCRDYRQLSGNHEYRLLKALWDVPELASTHPSMRELLGVPEASWTPYMTHLTLGRVTYMHDLGYSGVNALRATLRDFGGNVVFGHTHRAGTLYDGNARGERFVGMNVGFLGDGAAMDYLPEAKKVSWQLAVGLVDESHRGNVAMTVAPFVDGAFLLR